MKQKLRTVGIGLIDRVPGSFDLAIERVWATNELQEEDVIEDERQEEGGLKDSHGKKIKWGQGGGD
jgi:NADH dehydrogenase [ubiquinone] 1 alpha subcomplex assembly factor 1